MLNVTTDMKVPLYILCLLYTANVLAQEAPNFSIRLHGKAVLKISYRDNIRTRSIFTYTDNALPYRGEFRLQDSLVSGTQDKYITYDIASPQRGFFSIDNFGGTIYLVPNDTLTLLINLSQPNPWKSYNFEGTFKIINQYYFDQARTLKGVSTYERAILVNESPNLSSLKQKLDSLLQVEQQYLVSHTKQHPLPAWFIKKEQQQILYSDIACRTNAVIYRRFIKKDSVNAMPKNYFNFINADIINNPSAVHLPDYQNFLKDYFFVLYYQQKQIKSPGEYFPLLASKHLAGVTWDVFMIRLLSEWLAGIPTEGEQLLAKYYPKFTNKQWISEIKTFYEDAYNLKPGELAPNFALEDKLDSLAYLKDFKGQVIYLSFWFTGCAPCRQEMPLENELVKYFSGKPVKIVNICVKSSRPDWAKVSKLYNLQTVNLYANKAWESTLISKYNVKAYPHYVLIDQEGKVVKNNCSRPSDRAKEEIEAVLQQSR